MEAPDRREPPPLEVDLTKTEGSPTPRAALEIVLRMIGLKISGNAALPSPVMLCVIGVLGTVAIALGCVFGSQYVADPTLMLVGGGILATMLLASTTGLAVLEIKARRTSDGTQTATKPPGDAG